MTGRNRVRRGFLVFNLGISFKERLGRLSGSDGLVDAVVLWPGSVGRAVSVESIDEIVVYCTLFPSELYEPGLVYFAFQ